MESYLDLDIEKFTAIYSPEVTRVSMDLNKIESGASYFESIGSFFESITNMGFQMNIDFSILASATSENKVYQTGFYSISLRKNDKEAWQSTGYANFQVMLTNETTDASWKIVLDKDKQVKITEEEIKKAGTFYSLN